MPLIFCSTASHTRHSPQGNSLFFFFFTSITHVFKLTHIFFSCLTFSSLFYSPSLLLMIFPTFIFYSLMFFLLITSFAYLFLFFSSYSFIFVVSFFPWHYSAVFVALSSIMSLSPLHSGVRGLLRHPFPFLALHFILGGTVLKHVTFVWRVTYPTLALLSPRGTALPSSWHCAVVASRRRRMPSVTPVGTKYINGTVFGSVLTAPLLIRCHLGKA